MMSDPSRFCISIARSGDERDHRAVDMRAERDAALVDLAQLRQRHHLEAARVGQDRVGQFMNGAGRRAPRCARRPDAASGDRCCRAGFRRRSRARPPGCTPLTVACVPTGMKAGVRTTPCAVAISPRRAAPSVASSLKPKSEPFAA